MKNIIIEQLAKAYIVDGSFVTAQAITGKISEELPENVCVLSLTSEWKYPNLSTRKEILKKIEVFDPVKFDIVIDHVAYKGEFIKSFLHSWSIRGPNIEESGDANSADALPCELVDVMYEGIMELTKKAEDELGKV